MVGLAARPPGTPRSRSRNAHRVSPHSHHDALSSAPSLPSALSVAPVV